MTVTPSDEARWRRIAGVLLEEAGRLEDPASRSARLVEVGELHLHRLADPAGASQHFLAAARADPRAPQAALSRLAKLARETGDVEVTAHLVAALSHAGHWDDVVTVLERRAETAMDDAERSGLLLEASRVAEERLADPGRGRELLLRAAGHAAPTTRLDLLAGLEARFGLAPDDEAVGVALARLLVEEGRPLGAVDTLTTLAARSRDVRRKAVLLLDAAALCAERTARPVDALIHAYEAMVLDPGSADAALARIDAVRRRHGNAAEVVDTIERIYARLQRPDLVMQVLEGRLENAGGGERGDLLLRAAEHAEYGLLDPARSFEFYRAGLTEGAGDAAQFAAGMRRVGAEGVPGATRVMVELFGRLGLWRPLVEVLDDEAALTIDDAERAALLFQAGEVLENRLEDLEGAMRRYLQAFKLAPREPRYVAAGERLYRRRGDWAMVDRLLGLQAKVAPDSATRRRLLVDQARIRHRHLDRHLEAYESAREAVAHGAGDGGPSVLSDLVADERAFAQIEASLRRRAADEGAGEAARLLEELASLQIDLRRDVAAGRETLREAADLVPGNDRLFRRVAELTEIVDPGGEALAAWLASALERPLPRATQHDALRRAGLLHAGRLGSPSRGRDLLRRAAELDPQDAGVRAELVAAARAAREPAALASVLEAALAGRLGPPPDVQERKGLLRELGALHLGLLDDAEGAAACHREILEADPRDVESREALRAHLTAMDDWSGLAALLLELAAAHADEDETTRVALLEEVATIRETRLDDPHGAAAALAPLLRSSEGPRLRPWLLRLYAATGDRAGQLALLRLEIDEALDEGARLGLAERLVALAETPPPDRTHLVEGLRLVAGLRRDDPAPLERLAGLLRASGEHVELAEVLARRWALAPDDPESWPALRERAMLLGGPLGRAEAAIDAWELWLARVPGDADALKALQRAHEARGHHEAALAVLWRRYEAATGAEACAALAREAAVAAELRIGDRAGAIAGWTRVLAHQPGDTEAQDELMRLYEEGAEHAAFVGIAAQRLESLDPPERVELLRRVARLFAGPLADPARAEDTWAQLRRLDPGDAEALQALLTFAEGRSDLGTAAELLGALVGVTRDSKARRRLLERRATVQVAVGELAAAVDSWQAVRALAPSERTPITAVRELSAARKDWWTWAAAAADEMPMLADLEERVALERQFARVCDDELGDQQAAAAAWERVLTVRPGDREALGALKDLYGELGRPDDMVRALRVLLDAAPDDATRVVLLQDSARLIETHRGDLVEAFECWRRAFRLSADADPRMLAEMERLAPLAGLWPRYLEALDIARRRAIGREQEIDVLLRQARVAEDRVRDPQRAFELAEAAFELAPSDGPALSEMARLAEVLGAWDRLAVAYDRLLRDGADREQRAALLVRTADLYEKHLADPGRAFEAIAGALRAGAEDPGLMARLARLAETHGLWNELIELYGERWKRQTQTSARIATLHELARMLEPRDWERAFEQYLLALQLDPQDEATRAATWRIAGAHDAWGVVVRVLELKARDAEESWLRIALLLDVAALQEERLGDLARAMETLRAAFAIETWNEKTHRALRRVAERLGAWRELAGFFEEEAGWATEPHARLRLYREAAELLRAHDQGVEAGRILRHVLELDPTDAVADAALEGMLRDAGDDEGLAELLEARARRLGGDERVAALTALATVYRERLGRADKAEQVLQRLLALRPDDAGAFEALAATLEVRQEWDRLAAALDRRLHQLDRDDAEGRRVLLRRRAELLRGPLDRPREALRLLVRVAAELPEDIDLLFEIARLAQACDSHDELLACAERSAAVADPDRLPEVLCLVGRTARDRFGNRKKARVALARALELRADDLPLAREVAALLESEQRHADLAALLERHGPALVDAPGASESELRARWALRLAELQAERLFRVDAARETLRAALESAPRHLELLTRLRDLSLRARDGEAVREVVLRLSALAPDPVEVLASAARELERIGAQEPAVALWQSILDRVPDHEEAAAAVGRFGAARRDPALRVRALEARVEGAAGVERAAILCELAVLHRDQRTDLEAARAAFSRALEVDPDHLAALLGLVELARRHRDTRALDDLTLRLVRRLESEGDPDVVARVAPIVATLQLDQARAARARSDIDRALVCLRDAHRRAPEREDVAWALADTLSAAGELTEAAAVYARVPTLTPSPEAGEETAPGLKAAEHLRRARAFRAAGDDERAVRHFELAAQAPETRVEALEALANLQERAGRWEAAVRLREKLAEALEEPALRGAALMAAGLIAEIRLSKPARALSLYDRALAAGLNDRVLLERVLALYRDQQRPEAALAVVERLLADEADPNRAAELHATAGEMHRKRGHAPEARAAFLAAVERSPLLLPAVRGLLASLDDAPADEQRAALRAIWSGCTGLPGPGRLPVLELLGEALEARGDLPGALEVYEELLAADAEHLGARAALATLYGELAQRQVAAPEDAPHVERAIGHRLAYLRGRPGDPAALRDLATLYRAAGRPSWAVTPLRLLALLQRASREEVELLRTLRGPFDELRPLEATLRAELVADPTRRQPAGLLLRALHDWMRGSLSDALDPLLGAEAEALGEPASALHPPLADAAQALAAALDLPPCQLWIRESDDRTIRVARLDRPELVAGAGVLSLPEVERLFLLARALEATRGSAVLAIVAGDARSLFGAAIALALPEGGAEYAVEAGADPEAVAHWAEFLLDRLDGARLDALVQLAGPVVASGPRAFDEWLDATRRTAERTGFVMCGDLARAIVALQRESSEAVRGVHLTGPEAFRELVDRSPAVADLYRYAFGQAFHELLIAVSVTSR